MCSLNIYKKTQVSVKTLIKLLKGGSLFEKSVCKQKIHKNSHLKTEDLSLPGRLGSHSTSATG